MAFHEMVKLEVFLPDPKIDYIVLIYQGKLHRPRPNWVVRDRHHERSLNHGQIR